MLLIFQDDLARACTSVEAAKDGNNKIEKITNSKQLEINVDKSTYLIFGSKKKVREIRELIKNDPMKINNNTIKEKDSEKYLGDYIHNKGPQESIKKQ